MDEKLTPADVIRKGIDAVADAENKGINVSKDAETSFSLEVEDDAIEFASFQIDDSRDTAPGSKAGTRLPTVSLPSATVLPEVAATAPVEEVPEQQEVVAEEVKPASVEMEDISSFSEEAKLRKRHSKTWLRNHQLNEEAEAAAAQPKAEETPRALTQEELLEEILADTPDERRRKQAAAEEGRRLAQDIFSEKKTTRTDSSELEASVSEPTRIIDTEELDQMAALDRFLEVSKEERRARLREERPSNRVTAPVAEPSEVPSQESGYFGVSRKSGFTEEATSAAAGGRVIESRSMAVDPTTLSKKELREYNRINRRGDKERERLQKKAAKRAGKKRMKVWQRVLLILLALIMLVVGIAAGFFGRYYGLLGNLDIKDDPVQKIQVSDQSEANQKSLNILLVGLDSRKDNYTGRSDSMILCTINKSSKKFIMTSFLRDSYVTIPGHGKDKLNAAYAYGGSSLLANTIYENYGIVVDRTAVFNFMFVIDVIDYLGGVTVDVTDEELPYLNMYIHDQNEELYKMANPNKGQINSGPGTYNLTGNQALAYARIRYVGTDVARSERQRVVLSECLEKCKNLSAGELNKMATTFLPRIKTDLSAGDTTSLILTLLRAGNYQTNSMALPIDGTWTDAKAGDQDIVKIKDFEANTKAWEEMVS